VGLVDAVLFDLDGVLVDSRLAFARCVNAALESHGLPPRPGSELHGFIGPPLHDTFAQLGAGAAVESCVEAYRARYVERCAAETAVFAGIPEMLARLGPLSLLVATAKPKALAEPLLEAVGLRDRFLAVVGPDLDVEHETKAATIGRALTYLGPNDRAVMVGDRRFDVLGAAECGLPTVGVLWGIGDAAELSAAGATALAAEPGELLSILLATPLLDRCRH
jgi:phosphoglycolate phosphatase